MNYTETFLWKSTLAEIENDIHADERKLLREAYWDIRKNAAQLVVNISGDLQQYTVHDITHLDALWGIASEIVGPTYKLSPAEAFILGVAILIHDAGMCLAAYPDGIAELKKHKLWLSTINRIAKDPESPNETEIGLAVASLLRTEHANRAQELIDVSWKTSEGVEYRLIEKVELQQKFGEWIGDIAASHWWSHEKLATICDRILPAPPPFPTEWHIDLLKVASILRVADAAHVDERRAPGFIRALKFCVLNEFSDRHWLFQSRLTQPERRLDAIYYSSTKDFKIEEAEAWWLAYDTLQMIDDELRKTDVLLADLRGDDSRFCARRVANVESTKTIRTSISVKGWIPIETKIRISNVPHLVQTLGGEALYGQNTVAPLRELVQNAIDAIRVKSEVLPGYQIEDGIIQILLEEAGGELFLTVTDNGIGMTTEVISGPFLDFGTSGWATDPVFLDYPDASPQKIVNIGKFGIGFFSCFMLGEKISVTTRRFDRAFQDTLVMSFSGGPDCRPILRPAKREEWLSNGGTKIKVAIIEDAKKEYYSFKAPFSPASLEELCQTQFPTLEIKIQSNDRGIQKEIAPINWRTAEPAHLLKRINGTAKLPDYIVAYLANMRPLFDEKKEIVGRGFVVPRERYYEDEIMMHGIVASRGILAGNILGICGVLDGDVTTANRHYGMPKVSREELNRWLNEQAGLLVSMELPSKDQADCASIIYRLGGNPDELKICQLAKDGWLSFSELEKLANELDRIVVAHDFSIKEVKEINPTAIIEDNVIGVESIYSNIFQSPHGLRDIDNIYGGPRRNLEDLVLNTIGNVWKLDKEVIQALSRGRVDDLRLPNKIKIATTAENVEITAYGKIIMRGMTLDDLKKLATDN